MALLGVFIMGYKEVHASTLLYDHTKIVGGGTNEKMFDGDLATYFDASVVGYLGTFDDLLKVSKLVYISSSPQTLRTSVTYKDSNNVNSSAYIEDMNVNSYELEGYYYTELTPKTGTYLYEGLTVGTSVISSQLNEIEVYYTNDDSIPPAPITNLSYVFGDDNSVTYTYDFPTDPDFSHIEVYQDLQLIQDNHQVTSLKITGLTPESNYNFHFYAVDTSGNKSNVYSSTIQMPSGPDLIAPQNITSVDTIVSDDSIQFSYLLPIDSDFSHLQVYRNNELIAPNVQLSSFIDEGLEYETSYTYSFKSVDMSGNVSEGYSLTLQTMPYNDATPPSAPTGLEVIAGNSSLALSWFPNPENDVQGYNVYVDGVKRNGSLIFGNSYSMTNLANANEYLIQISAVDTNGNESSLTAQIPGIPDASKIPFFKLDNDLTDVVESTENWFSELWLVVAFSAGIPLAFVVGNRIKSLFFA